MKDEVKGRVMVLQNQVDGFEKKEKENRKIMFAGIRELLGDKDVRRKVDKLDPQFRFKLRNYPSDLTTHRINELLKKILGK